MLDLLNELRSYIKENYSGTDPFYEVNIDKPKPRKEENVVVFYQRACESQKTYNKRKNVTHEDKQKSVDSVVNTETYIPPLTKLENKISLEELLNMVEPTFSDKLFQIIVEKDLNEVDVYKKANIDRRLFSKLRNKDYKPSKNTILALIISLKLNAEEARNLLSYAGYNLAPNDKTDVIVGFFLEKQEYDICKINEVLYRYDLKCLGNVTE